MKPVYILNGFLDSGKSEFINYTISQPYFKIKGKTLLIVCEEGEVEYSEAMLKKNNTIMEIIEEESEMTTSKMMELEKKYNPERIIIEYNGMWDFRKLKLPFHWKVEQQITTIDASTFSLYFTNMRSLLAEMLKKSEMIIFNRCDDIEDLALLKRNVKAINQNAEIIFEDKDGEIDSMFEEDLPYDLNAAVIKLDGLEYGIWYLDMLDHLDRYIGKKVEFTALAAIPERIPEGYFVPGRMAMTCCADDMVYLGFVCKYDQAKELKSKEWVKITAVIKEEYWADYKGEGPVLYAEKVERTKAPKEEIISFA